mgnify:CR=1 FL=1
MGDEHFPTLHRRARKPHRCVECYRTIAPGDTYARFAGVGDGSAWSEPMCLACEALNTYAWRLVRTICAHEEDGPRFGQLVAWLAECDPPELVAAEMPPDTATHFLRLVRELEERTNVERELRRVARLQR